MKLLTIDTSTSWCGVALSDDGSIVAECQLNLGRRLAADIVGHIDLLLASVQCTPADLDGFGIALGPGSFTGLRIGAATVKGLALATGKPVAGFSSLAMLAMNLPHAAFQVCPMFDARKQEVYAGLYLCGEMPAMLMDDCVLPPERFLDGLAAPTLFVGEGAVRYRDLIVNRIGTDALFAPPYLNHPRAAAGAHLAHAALERGDSIPLPLLAPRYLRASEAETARLNATRTTV